MKVGTKIAAMAAGSFLIMLIVGGTSFYSVSKLLDTFRWVDHTELVLDKLSAIYDRVIEAQSANRAFIIMNDPEQFAAVHDAETECRKVLGELRQLTLDNSSQQHRLDRLEPRIATAFQEIKNAAELFKKSGFDAVLVSIRAGDTRMKVDEIKHIISEMMDTEKGLLRKRTQDMQDSSQATYLTIAFGTLLAVAFVTLAGYLIVQDITGPINHLIRASQNIGRGRFDAASVITSRDEFAELAMAFNDLGQTLEKALSGAELERRSRYETESFLSEIRRKIESLEQLCADAVATASERVYEYSDHEATVEAITTTGSALATSANGIAGTSKSIRDGSLHAEHTCGQTSRLQDELQSALSNLAQRLSTASTEAQNVREQLTELTDTASLVDDVADAIRLITLSSNIEAGRSNTLGDYEPIRATLIEELKNIGERCRQMRLKVNQLVARCERAAEKSVNSHDHAAALLDTIGLASISLHDKLKDLSVAVSGLSVSTEALVDASHQHATQHAEVPVKLDRMIAAINRQNYHIKQSEEQSQAVLTATIEIHRMLSEDTTVVPKLLV